MREVVNIREAILVQQIFDLRSLWPNSFRDVFGEADMFYEGDCDAPVTSLESEVFAFIEKDQNCFMGDLSNQGRIFILPSMCEYLLRYERNADWWNNFSHFIEVSDHSWESMLDHKWLRAGLEMERSVLYYLQDLDDVMFEVCTLEVARLNTFLGR